MIPVACWDEQLAVHARLLEEPVAPGAGAEPEQVVHPLRRLAEQRHVRVGAARADVVGAAAVEVDALALEPGDVGREVGLDADDRLDPGGLGLLVELVGPEHVAVVGHRHRRLAQLGGPLGQLGRAARRRRAWSTRCARAGGRRSPGPGIDTVGLSSGSSMGTPMRRRRRVQRERRWSWGRTLSLRRLGADRGSTADSPEGRAAAEPETRPDRSRGFDTAQGDALAASTLQVRPLDAPEAPVSGAPLSPRARLEQAEPTQSDHRQERDGRLRSDARASRGTRRLRPPGRRARPLPDRSNA